MTGSTREPHEPRSPLRFLLKPLAVLDAGIARVEAVILAYGVLLMATNSVANVIGRFVFNQSLYFAEEINQFLIVLITFMGLGYATRQGRHIRMSAIYDQLPDLGKKILMIVIAGVTSAVMFVLAYYAYEYVHRLWMLKKVTPSLQVPLYLTYLWVPVGFVIAGIQYALTVVKNLQSKDVYISYEKIDMYEETEDAIGGAPPSAGGPER